MTILNVPVTFGGVSIGKLTAKLSVKVSRENLSVTQADETFCGHRLTGGVRLGQKSGDPDQGELFPTGDAHEVKGTFDVKSTNNKPDSIGFGLTFNLKDIDISELAKFSAGTGMLIVSEVSEIPDDAPTEEHSPTDAGQLKSEGPWVDHPLSKLFTPAVVKACAEHDLTTLGQYQDFVATGKDYRDFKGIGEEKFSNMTNRVIDFIAANPDTATDGPRLLEDEVDG